MNLLALITLYFAVAVQAIVSVDWAIIADDGASLGDCVYSLLHENKLGAKWIKHSTSVKTVAVCHSPEVSFCRPGSSHAGENWTPVLCLQHYAIDYASGHLPETHQSFRNSHGLCHYRPYRNDPIPNFCYCEDVGIKNQCEQLRG